MLNGIGATVKQLRVTKGMTLKDLSAATGLSTGFLSQLERGLNSVAIDSLATIAEALGVTLQSFINQIDGKKDDGLVVKSYEKEIFFAENHNYIQYHLTADRSDKSFLARYIEIMPSPGGSEPISYTHGGEEFVYILEGILTLYFNNTKRDLYPGDSAHYHSETEHAWGNSTNKAVRFISVHTPNLFRTGLDAE